MLRYEGWILEGAEALLADKDRRPRTIIFEANLLLAVELGEREGRGGGGGEVAVTQ